MNVKDIAPKGWVTTMEHGGYKAQLMRAKRLRGEGVFELPMGQEIPVYPISVLPGSPKSWVRMPGTYV